ncbi:MAG: CapA family protein [Erysipelotrichaceae bacterium]
MKKLILLVISLMISGCIKAKPIDPPVDPIYPKLVYESSLDLIMVGDAVVHSNIYKDANKKGVYEFSQMMDKIKPIIEPYDLAFYNQETIIGGDSLGFSNFPRFNTPEAFGDDMVDMGFNLISLANNHVMDKGPDAVLFSNAFWAAKDVVVAGTYSSQAQRDTIPIYTKNKITYAFLAYTYGTNGLNPPSDKVYMVSKIDIDAMTKDITQVRSKVDVVIVSVHWGSEYQISESANQRSVAEALAKAGADIIIGHHPHVIEPIQWIGKTLVLYSLGNFISGQYGTQQLIGLMAAVSITKTVYQNGVIIKVGNLKADLCYTHYNARMRDVEVYPFDEPIKSVLPDYQSWANRFEAILNTYNTHIKLSSLRK